MYFNIIIQLALISRNLPPFHRLFLRDQQQSCIQQLFKKAPYFIHKSTINTLRNMQFNKINASYKQHITYITYNYTHVRVQFIKKRNFNLTSWSYMVNRNWMKKIMLLTLVHLDDSCLIYLPIQKIKYTDTENNSPEHNEKRII